MCYQLNKTVTNVFKIRIAEAAAAKGSGMKVALLVRSGNGPLTDEEKAEYDTFTTFDDIHSEFVIGKRKHDDVVTAEVK